MYLEAKRKSRKVVFQARCKVERNRFAESNLRNDQKVIWETIRNVKFLRLEREWLKQMRIFLVENARGRVMVCWQEVIMVRNELGKVFRRSLWIPSLHEITLVCLGQKQEKPLNTELAWDNISLSGAETGEAFEYQACMR